MLSYSKVKVVSKLCKLAQRVGLRPQVFAAVAAHTAETDTMSSARPDVRTVSHMASAAPKSFTRKLIHGEAGGPMGGVPMAGVINYPFKVNERLYYDDFAGAIASRITHP